jgi:hypothetical protein
MRVDAVTRRFALTLAAAGAAVALTATTTPPAFLAVLYQQEVLDRSALAAGLGHRDRRRGRGRDGAQTLLARRSLRRRAVAAAQRAA